MRLRVAGRGADGEPVVRNLRTGRRPVRGRFAPLDRMGSGTPAVPGGRGAEAAAWASSSADFNFWIAAPRL